MCLLLYPYRGIKFSIEHPSVNAKKLRTRKHRGLKCWRKKINSQRKYKISTTRSKAFQKLVAHPLGMDVRQKRMFHYASFGNGSTIKYQNWIAHIVGMWKQKRAPLQSRLSDAFHLSYYF